MYNGRKNDKGEFVPLNRADPFDVAIFKDERLDLAKELTL